MIKSMILTCLFSLIGYALPASAQMFGQPMMGQPMMGSPVYGAGMDPGYGAWGSGQNMMAQPCGYGGQNFDPIEDDEDVQSAEEDADDRKEALHDAREELLEAKKKAREAKRELEGDIKDHGTDTADGLVAAYETCRNIVWTTDGTKTKQQNCVADIGKAFSDSRSEAQCYHAQASHCDEGADDLKDLCVPDDQKALSAKEFFPGSDGGVNTSTSGGKYSACRTHFQKYIKAKEEMDAATKKVKEARADIKKSAKEIREAKREAKKNAKEEADLDKEEGLDASYAGCADCQRASKQKLDKNAMALGFGLGGAEILAQALVGKSIANQNARLGYPTGPNPYVGAIGAGFPFIMGGLYGATQGGMSYGGYGCSPTMAGGMQGGGPWMGGPYAGMGYPYGGGMYNPGYAPWGYNGPWGAGQGGGMGMGMPMGGGFGGPFGPFMGQGLGGGMPGYGIGGGFGMGMGSPFGMGGGFGLGGPFAGGGMPGYGMGGIGAGMGAGGFGLGGYGYGQQMQSYDDMSRRMALYTQTMQQSYQLQGQAQQYAPMGGGYGGGYGGYGGGFGLGIGGYGGGYNPYGTQFSIGAGIGFNSGIASPYQYAQPYGQPYVPSYNGR